MGESPMPRWNMKDPAFPKLVLLVNGCIPLALLCYDAYYHHLGPNPAAQALQTTGLLALIFLLLSLAVTPVRKITGYNFLSHFRRMLGLFAFFYASIHLLIYFMFDRSLDFSGAVKDILARPFILVGMTALALMIPLALTSTNGMIKRLGAARWKRLHRLAYVSAIAGVLHYYLLVKADITQPVAFGIVLAILLGYRVIAKLRQMAKAARAVREFI
jgi:DMSO/TMAO reductase YedYZ heme-binding membrane subunit